MEVNIQPDIFSASRAAAVLTARIVRENPKAVLGLAADGSLRPFYKELVRMYREEGLDFSGVTVFSLDGNAGNLSRLININPATMHMPLDSNDYEQAVIDAGGLDIQVMAIGSAGQLTVGDAVMNARMCLMLAFGSAAAPAVAAAVEGPVSSGIPAWILKQHSCAQIFMDEAAAEELKLKDYYHWVRTGETVQQMPPQILQVA